VDAYHQQYDAEVAKVATEVNRIDTRTETLTHQRSILKCGDPAEKRLSHYHCGVDDRPPYAITFVLRLAEALHAYGYSAGQLESAMTAGAASLGFEAQFFSTPASILASVGRVPDQQTLLIRTYPGPIDLGKLA
jgi:Putative threonine/serine exporter